jgi:photosystem II stability/assembly factor-like uncharacterized protein
MKKKGFWLTMLTLMSLTGFSQIIIDPDPGSNTPGERDSSEPPEFVRERYEWLYRHRFSPDGLLHGKLRLNAWHAAQQLPNYLTNPRDIQQHSWEFLGPQSVTDGWNGSVTAGQITALALDPIDTATLYAGAANGGLWKSYDGGLSWHCITSNLPTSSSGAIAIDPLDRNTIYYGTGEFTLSLYSYGGSGIFRSRDGGLTWEHLGANLFAGQRCAEIVLHPSKRNRLWAGMSEGVFKSTDGGSTWRPVLKGCVQSLFVHPQQPDMLYAAIGDMWGSSLNGFYFSTDEGENWKRFADLPTGTAVGRVEATLCRDAPGVMYVGFAGVWGGLVGLYKTVNGGQSWQYLWTAPDYGAHQSWYNNAIAVDPQNPNTLYLGGLSFWRSTDGGQTWRDVGRSYSGGGLHADIQTIVVHPFETNILFVGCDGGVYRSLDRGNSWTARNMTLANVEFYTVWVNPRNPQAVIGGTQDNGSLLKPETSLHWRVRFWGDSGACFYKQTDPNTLFIQYWFLDLYRSRNGGANWEPISNGLHRVGALFVAPFIPDPQDPNRIYAGSRVLSRSDDEGNTWHVISPDFGSSITAIAVAPSDNGVIYIGLENGQVHRSTNSGQTWSQVSNGLQAQYITSIAISRSNSDQLYATSGGFGRGTVFYSSTGGQAWSNITGNLPRLPVNTCFIHPSSSNMLIVGTDIGIFITPDRGSSWFRWQNGLPASITVMQMHYFEPTNQLYIATHGRGVWRAIIPNPSAGARHVK